MPDNEFKDRVDGGIGVGLGICAPAQEIALGEQIRAESREEAPAVQPVVALKSRLRQGLHSIQRSLKKGDVFSMNVRSVSAQLGLILMKAELAGPFRKKLARFLEPVFCKGCEVGADFSLCGI